MRCERPVVFDAGLVQLVELEHIISSEIRLTPSIGHTPSHVSVTIESEGKRAVITGDIIAARWRTPTGCSPPTTRRSPCLSVPFRSSHVGDSSNGFGRSTMLGPSQQIDIKRRLIRSVALYYAIAIGWAWLVWAPLILGADGLKILSISPSLPVLTCIATLGPSLGCFITRRIETGDWRAIQLLPRSKRRWGWVLLGPLLVLLCTFVVLPAFISSGSPAQWRWHPSVLFGMWFPMFNYNLLGGAL
jgi:hypothetical protein